MTVFCIGLNDLAFLFIASITLAAGDKNGSAVTLLSNVSTTFTEVYFYEEDFEDDEAERGWLVKNRDFTSLLFKNTGTPLIGRFLGPRKNRLNRKPSYWRSLYGINL